MAWFVAHCGLGMFVFQLCAYGQGSATSTAAVRSAQPEGAPLPHWCEDLGIRFCMTDAHAPASARGAITRRLRAEDPRRFLPAEMIMSARLCETARQRSVEASLSSEERQASIDYRRQHCGARGALARELGSLVFIPVDTLRQAQLPRSGARIVVDCQGRHLQLRGDLPWAEQLTLIRDSLSEVYQVAAATALPRRASASEALSCDPEAATRALTRHRRVRTESSMWVFRRRGDGSVWEAASAAAIPRDYVTASCFPTGTPRSAYAVSGATPAETVRLLIQSLVNLEAEVNRLDQLLYACEAGNDSWNHSGSAGYPCESLSTRYNEAALEQEERMNDIRERISSDAALRESVIKADAAFSAEIDDARANECDATDDECFNEVYEEALDDAGISESFDTIRDWIAGGAFTYALNEQDRLQDLYHNTGCSGPGAVDSRCVQWDQEIAELENIRNLYSDPNHVPIITDELLRADPP